MRRVTRGLAEPGREWSAVLGFDREQFDGLLDRSGGFRDCEVLADVDPDEQA